MFHTVVSNDDYNTSPSIVTEVFNKCLDACEQNGGVEVVAVSALGCGYGDLSHTEFVQLVNRVAQDYQAKTLKEIVICCKNNNFYQEMLSAH